MRPDLCNSPLRYRNPDQSAYSNSSQNFASKDQNLVSGHTIYTQRRISMDVLFHSRGSILLYSNSFSFQFLMYTTSSTCHSCMSGSTWLMQMSTPSAAIFSGCSMFSKLWRRFFCVLNEGRTVQRLHMRRHLSIPPVVSTSTP